MEIIYWCCFQELQLLPILYYYKTLLQTIKTHIINTKHKFTSHYSQYVWMNIQCGAWACHVRSFVDSHKSSCWGTEERCISCFWGTEERCISPICTVFTSQLVKDGERRNHFRIEQTFIFIEWLCIVTSINVANKLKLD